jgi:hypothetical protein
MIWIILAIIAGLVIAFLAFGAIWTEKGTGVGERIWYSVLALFMIITGVFGVSLISNLVASFAVGDHCESNGSNNIAALQDNSSTSGSFFLGSGSIDDQAVFYYYAANNGEYSLLHTIADNVIITETDDTPQVYYWKAVSDNKFWYVGGFAHCSPTFHVPKGSIISNYTLDAQ